MILYMTTLANGIIGVSVLAMPYCFKQCGIILATFMLLLSSILSRLACHFLIKSAVMTRRRNYEFLAFHAYGNMGKFLVELFSIGFLLGTCVAYFVVIGDLGPEIVGKIVDKSPQDIRTSLMITSAIFIVLPLGLLKNIDSLSSVCIATIIFYVILVLKVISESTSHVLAEDWYAHVYYWRPAGILQCVPIFSMALFCQTQLFEIYETIPNATLDKMNAVVKGALNICTSVYLCVGFFGYIAFCTQPFTGNILMSFEPNLTSETMKIGFVFSVAFSFPLVIFPCRASLNSLLYRRVAIHDATNYIPETRFRCLTFLIVGISLLIGILIPNIEFVLGLLGSTIGVMICLIFPAAFFISINNKHTNETFLAHFIILIGIWILTLGTYANLYAMEESTNNQIFGNTKNFENPVHHIPLNIEENVLNIPELKENKFQLNLKLTDEKVISPVIRPEPPIPIDQEKLNNPVKEIENLIPLPSSKTKEEPKIIKDTNIESIPKLSDENKLSNNLNAIEKVIVNKDSKQLANDQANSNMNNINNNNNNLINSDAIQKEESELAAEAEVEKEENVKRHEEFRKTLEKYTQEQQIKILKETKEILEDIYIKEQKKELEKTIHKSKEPDEKEKSVVSKLQTNLTDENNNVPKKVKDHIMGALTKGINKDDEQKKHEKLQSLIINTEEKNVSGNEGNNQQQVEKDKLPIPIVLKMNNNQTIKTKNLTGENNVDVDDNEPSLARRDILHKHEREKRDANILYVNNVDVKIDVTKFDMNVKSDSCIKLTKTEDEISEDENNNSLSNNNNKITMHEVKLNDVAQDKVTSSENPVDVERLIKTNVYLSQQDFTEKTISVTSDVILDSQFTQLKKRDLKALKSDNYL